MLKITTDGRKAALDIRLVDSNEPFTQQSKVYRCAENVFDIYLKTDGTQLVFATHQRLNQVSICMMN